MVKRLPPGRHHLTRDEVASDQRRRMFKAMAKVMSKKGYTETTVTDIIKGAKVSRHTFYEHFDSKHDCFMSGYARLQQHMIDGILTVTTVGTPMQRFDALLGNYLTALASDPATSRVYLVEVSAAGPEAMKRRLQIQRRFVDAVVEVFRARSKTDRFACEALVGGIATVAFHALLDGGAEAVLQLHGPIMAFAARVFPTPATPRTAKPAPSLV